MSNLDENSFDLLTEYLIAKGRYDGPGQVHGILNELAKNELTRMESQDERR